MQAFRKPPSIPIFLPDVSAAEKGFEAAKEAAHLFHLTGQAKTNSAPATIPAAERIQKKFASYRVIEQSHKQTSSPIQERSESDSKSEKIKNEPSRDPDDTSYLKGIHLYPLFASKRSAPDAAAAAAAAAAVLQDSEADSEADSSSSRRAVVYRPTAQAWPSSPPIISEHYEAVSPSIETVSDSSPAPAQASVAGAEMVEVPIPLQDLSPPTPAVARSFPTPFSLPSFDTARSDSAEETREPAPPQEAPQATAESGERFQDSDSDSYQVKVRLPARPSPYVPWVPAGVGSINVNFGADAAKAESDSPAQESRQDEERRKEEAEAQPTSDSEADSEPGQSSEKTQDEKDSEEETKKAEEEAQERDEQQVQAAEESKDEEDANGADGDHEEGDLQAGQAAAASPPSSAPFEEPAAAALWSYRSPETGPARWGELGFPTCSGGAAQSPINIEFDVRPAGLPPLAWRVPEGSGAFQAGGAAPTARVLYNGRAVVVGGLDAVMAGEDGAEYALRAIHVHTPSEHAVGGLHYDMELHFVHSAVVDGEARPATRDLPAALADPLSFFFRWRCGTTAQEYDSDVLLRGLSCHGRIRYLIVAALFSRAERSVDFVAGLAAALPSLKAGGEALSVDFPAVAMAVLGQVSTYKQQHFLTQRMTAFISPEDRQACLRCSIRDDDLSAN